MKEREPGPRAIAGWLLLIFPVVIQIPYAMLIASFDYPSILREPPAVILARFAAGAAGGGLTALWLCFALAILPLLLGILLLPLAIPDSKESRWLAAATPLGAASALAQMAGLLRWTVLAPHLASAWAEAGSDLPRRRTIELLFQAQHQLFGVLLGEFLGQILLGLWTISVVLTLRGTLGRGWFHWLGLLAGILFLAGSGGSLAATFPALSPLDPLGTLAFLAWSVWCCFLGWAVIRRPVTPAPADRGR